MLPLKKQIGSDALLTVCKASAGSGKTYRLTRDYIAYLLASPGKKAYREVLAVTFTNKATSEMKNRILKELYRLSTNPEKSPYKTYYTEIFEATPQEIGTVAGELLLQLLYDYSSFHISTIDRFFLQIVRSFTREISLQSNYNIELDTDKVLVEAVKNMFFSLDGNPKLLDWLKTYVKERIEENSSWNPEKEILTLARELFKESYKIKLSGQSQSGYEKLHDKQQLEAYKRELRAYRSNFEHKMEEIADCADKIIENQGLNYQSFKGARYSFMNQFGKIRQKNYDLKETFKKSVGNVDLWYAKDASSEVKDAIKSAYGDGLNDCMEKLVSLVGESEFIFYNTAQIILKQINTLGIFSDIEYQIQEYSQKEGILLLSNVNEFLSKIIDQSDTPFIYEKVGAYLRHFMIDEFQDTSFLQWQNFFPLIKNSLSEGNENLLVGDVKQSIYRWRSSDWDLLNTKLEKDYFRSKEIKNVSLKDNWRSDKNIVKFNNAFFDYSAKEAKRLFLDLAENASGISGVEAQSFADKISTAYCDIEQTPKSESTGYVEVDFFDKKDSDETVVWKQRALQELVRRIDVLRAKGYALRDMAILVRRNSEAVEIAEYLLGQSTPEHEYAVISNEALLIHKNDSVQFLASLLTATVKPQDTTNLVFLLLKYFVLVKGETESDALQNILGLNLADWKQVLFNKEDEWRALCTGSLFEQIENFISYFGLLSVDKGQSAFIQAFQDVVFEFESKNAVDALRFLNYWEEVKGKRFLSIPDKQDAIRIYTVHKSKGLEFKAVFIPFCDWTLDSSNANSLFWTKPTVSPFDGLPLIPVKYTSKLKDTIFAKDYFGEKMQYYVDALNTAYVAFTRACNVLFVFAPKKTNKKEMDAIPELLYEKLNGQPGWCEESSLFCIGEIAAPMHETMSESEAFVSSYFSKPVGGWFHLYFEGEKKWKLSEENPKWMQVNYGVLMHELLSKVTDKKDIETALGGFVSEGRITNAEKLELKLKINNFIEQNGVEEWFSGRYKVLNEVEILQNKKALRPDRVMLDEMRAIIVDYKFGKVESPSYVQQVKSYKKVVADMGFSVEGYLCYLELGKMLKVD